MSLADRIQSLRKTKGVSQQELADQVGVSRQAVSKWESEQSVPELDKVISMSDYFGVTTDYILKGVEASPRTQNNSRASQILYIASTALLAIGLLAAFGSWYTEQSAESIWGSMVIQVVGVVAYYIGKCISQSKPPFVVNWLNTVIALFMPISLIVTHAFNRVVAPYPTDIPSTIAFSAVYFVAVVLSFIVLKKRYVKE